MPTQANIRNFLEAHLDRSRADQFYALKKCVVTGGGAGVNLTLQDSDGTALSANAYLRSVVELTAATTAVDRTAVSQVTGAGTMSVTAVDTTGNMLLVEAWDFG